VLVVANAATGLVIGRSMTTGEDKDAAAPKERNAFLHVAVADEEHPDDANGLVTALAVQLELDPDDPIPG
jgi:hypothetical protein